MRSITYAICLCLSYILLGQEEKEITQNPFNMDLLAGPYLLLDDVGYQSVFMKGTRLGYQTKNNFGFNIEYLIGNQRDKTDLIGTTHSATGMAQYFLTHNSSRFRPYGYLGGGFFEFKDFSKDAWGLSFYAGGGSEVNFKSRIKGYFECRYLNIGNLDLGGKNQLGVFWGIKALF